MQMHKKYDTERVDGKLRIRALVNIDGIVRIGQYGGVIDSEENLSQSGKCWITEGAKAIGNSKVLDDAILSGNSVIKDRAVICQGAKAVGSSVISGQSIIKGSAEVNSAKIQGGSKVGKLARVLQATVKDNSLVTGQAFVNGSSTVIKNGGKVYDYGYVDGNTEINGCDINGYAAIRNPRGQALIINNTSDYANIKTSSECFGPVTYIRGGIVVITRRPIHSNNLVFRYDEIISWDLDNICSQTGFPVENIRKFKNFLRSMRVAVEGVS